MHGNKTLCRVFRPTQFAALPLWCVRKFWKCSAQCCSDHRLAHRNSGWVHAGQRAFLNYCWRNKPVAEATACQHWSSVPTHSAAAGIDWVPPVVPISKSTSFQFGYLGKMEMKNFLTLSSVFTMTLLKSLMGELEGNQLTLTPGIGGLSGTMLAPLQLVIPMCSCSYGGNFCWKASLSWLLGEWAEDSPHELFACPRSALSLNIPAPMPLLRCRQFLLKYIEEALPSIQLPKSIGWNWDEDAWSAPYNSIMCLFIIKKILENLEYANLFSPPQVLLATVFILRKANLHTYIPKTNNKLTSETFSPKYTVMVLLADWIFPTLNLFFFQKIQ